MSKVTYPYTSPITFPLKHPNEVKKVLAKDSHRCTIVFNNSGWSVQAPDKDSFWSTQWVETRAKGIDDGIECILEQLRRLDI